MTLSATQKIILAFATLLIGIVLISSVAINTQLVTTPTQVTSESLNIASLRIVANNINASKNVTLANAGLLDAGGWVDNSVTIKNASGTTISTGNFTVDYTNDRITFLNTTFMVQLGGAGNTTLATYQYYASDYLNATWQRTVLNMIGGFFAIALMLISVGLFYSVGKDIGII